MAVVGWPPPIVPYNRHNG